MKHIYEPKIESWMDEGEIEFRKEAHQVILNLQHYSPTLVGYKFEYYFSSGISSLVGVAALNDKQVVFKTARSQQSLLREVTFLKLWSESGVKTPRVFDNIEIEHNKLGKIRIIIMEFIDRKSAFQELVDAPKSDHITTWKSIGKILACTHQVKATGFGKPVEPDFRTGKYLTLQEYLADSLLSDSKKNVLAKHGYDLIKMERAWQTLTSIGLQSFATHYDLGLHNVLGSGDDLILFDPDPTINSNYLDLATSYLWAVIQSGQESADEMINSYKGIVSEESFNPKLFQAGLTLRLYSKHSNWLEKTSDEVAADCINKTTYLVSETIS